jgi:hypothetical protein
LIARLLIAAGRIALRILIPWEFCEFVLPEASVLPEDGWAWLLFEEVEEAVGVGAGGGGGTAVVAVATAIACAVCTMAACVATLMGTVLTMVGGAETTTWPVGVVVTVTVMTTSAPPVTATPPTGAFVGVEPERPPEFAAVLAVPPEPVPPVGVFVRLDYPCCRRCCLGLVRRSSRPVRIVRRYRWSALVRTAAESPALATAVIGCPELLPALLLTTLLAALALGWCPLVLLVALIVGGGIRRRALVRPDRAGPAADPGLAGHPDLGSGRSWRWQGIRAWARLELKFTSPSTVESWKNASPVP